MRNKTDSGEISCKIVIDNIIKYVAIPAQQTEIQNILDQIENNNHLVLALNTKSQPNSQAFFPSVGDRNPDVSRLLQAFLKKPEYCNEFRRLLSLLKFENLTEIQDLLRDNLSNQSIDEKIAIELLNLYCASRHEIYSLYYHKSFFATIVYHLIVNQFTDAIVTFKTLPDFKTMGARYLLSMLKTKEEFLSASQWVDFSKSKIQFLHISEDVLIALWELFPERLFKDLNQISDDYRYMLKTTIFDYAAREHWYKLLQYLSDKTDDRIINGESINSLEAAKIVYDNNFIINNEEKNIYCVEFKMQNNEKLPSICLSETMLIDALRNQLNHVVLNALNSTNNDLLTPNFLIEVCHEYAYSYHVDRLKLAVNGLAKTIDNTNEILLFKLFEHALTPPGSFNLTNLLLDRFASKIWQHFHIKDQVDFNQIITGLHDPKIISLLLKYDFPVSDVKIAECFRIACIENDEVNSYYLSNFMNNKTNPWPYTSLEANDSCQDRGILPGLGYGEGITQLQYQNLHTRMVNYIVSHLLNNSFCLIPQNFEMMHLLMSTEYEKNYLTQCNLITLGAFRYWMAFISNSENSHYFGRGRFQSFYTECNIYYEKYFNRFFENIANYKDSPFIKWNAAQNGSDKPLCTIIGYIDNQPIELTSYAYHLDSYTWVHTETRSIVPILNHCQTLINEINKLDINNSNPSHIADLSEKIGHVHWWMAHGCPYSRGSASISEAICRALFKSHGLEITWKSMPDCEALIMPSETDYAKNYCQLLNVTSLPLKSITTEMDAEEPIVFFQKSML